VLVIYDPYRRTRVETDASDGVVARVLSQLCEDKKWHPIGYYSSTMSPAERNYTIHDKELLAVIRALEEWDTELRDLRRPESFEIITDHKALEYFMTKRTLNARQARWSEVLNNHNFVIVYRLAKSNVLADTLTR
jgi:ribonuclease HI